MKSLYALHTVEESSRVGRLKTMGDQRQSEEVEARIACLFAQVQDQSKVSVDDVVNEFEDNLA